jgi:Raf kinase inhibitor-like YbhB/YbcL family protein
MIRLNASGNAWALAWGLVAKAIVDTHDGQPVAIERAQLQSRRMLTVSSALFRPGDAIPRKYSAYDQNVSPPLRWTPVQGAKSYLLIAEDPDAKAAKDKPMLHWLVWNIPANVQSLAEGLKAPVSAQMQQGPNGHGETGYAGMRPPAGDGPHHYHFELFALDRVLDVAPGADRAAVLAAASGHVLASGELVGTFEQKSHRTR